MSVSTFRIVGITTLLCAPVFAGSLTVIVKDPAQAGRATFDQFPAGAYRMSVTKDGFADWEGPVTIGDQPANPTVSLKLGTLSTSVQVSARRSPLANSEPNYQAIRTGKLRQVYRVSNLVLTRDACTFTFRSGSFSFLPGAGPRHHRRRPRRVDLIGVNRRAAAANS